MRGKAGADLFGRLFAIDERDNAFRARSILARAHPPESPYRFFHVGFPMHQRGPQAVAYALAAYRQIITGSAGDPDATHRAAHAADPWAGVPHEGTTIHAGLKVMQAEGVITGYVWSRDAGEVVDWLLLHGPVVVGSVWTQAMMDAPAGDDPLVIGDLTDPENVMGNHCYLLIGYSDRLGAVRLLNSWGRGWGENGRAWVKVDDLQRLLDEATGQACMPIAPDLGIQAVRIESNEPLWTAPPQAAAYGGGEVPRPQYVNGPQEPAHDATEPL